MFQCSQGVHARAGRGVAIAKLGNGYFSKPIDADEMSSDVQKSYTCKTMPLNKTYQGATPKGARIHKKQIDRIKSPGTRRRMMISVGFRQGREDLTPSTAPVNDKGSGNFVTSVSFMY